MAKWTFRLLAVASLGFLLLAYGQSKSSSGAGTEGSYSDDIERTLARLKELARALQ